MNFILPVETYLRLAALPARFTSKSVTEEEKKLLQCVRLENKNGHAYAIATNRRIAAVFYLGATDQPDGAAHITIDKRLLAQCETEKAFNSQLFVTTIPMLNAISLKTTLGYVFPEAGGFFSDETPMKAWRTWVPKQEAAMSVGAMKWNLSDMMALNACSPSGDVVFPEFIDANQPVIIRDYKVDNWLAMFMSNILTEDGKVMLADPATLPTWWNT
jgi:hypothetical protein